ncbi:hypothetical protein [Streptomyces uncialis]|uniref:Uncharacterized protein n=1 Tax=Streptomyces uncialis TaxID=1048205 RepID=A0A1Q4VCJ1_9ACTN|nr:hypothetical protein [Streptomyces uncialis]OKH95410.1 hypothetical protein AB852_00630 [Streptomyces uncialis]
MVNPETWVKDEKITPATLNSRIRDVNIGLSEPAHAVLWGSPAYTITGNGATHELRFSSASANRMKLLTTGSVRRGATVTEAGVYDVELQVTSMVQGGAPDSHLIIFLTVNGKLVGRGIFTARTAYQQTAHTKRLLHLEAGDHVTARCFTDSGRVMEFGYSTSGSTGCRFSMHRIGNYPWTPWS